jgi:hypothetical protein
MILKLHAHDSVSVSMPRAGISLLCVYKLRVLVYAALCQFTRYTSKATHTVVTDGSAALLNDVAASMLYNVVSSNAGFRCQVTCHLQQRCCVSLQG